MYSMAENSLGNNLQAVMFSSVAQIIHRNKILAGFNVRRIKHINKLQVCMIINS